MTQETIATAIRELRADFEEVEKKRRTINFAIENIQQMCEHEFELEGSAHGENLMKCSICGKESWK